MARLKQLYSCKTAIAWLTVAALGASVGDSHASGGPKPLPYKGSITVQPIVMKPHISPSDLSGIARDFAYASKVYEQIGLDIIFRGPRAWSGVYPPPSTCPSRVCISASAFETTVLNDPVNSAAGDAADGVIPLFYMDEFSDGHTLGGRAYTPGNVTAGVVPYPAIAVSGYGGFSGRTNDTVAHEIGHVLLDTFHFAENSNGHSPYPSDLMAGAAIRGVPRTFAEIAPRGAKSAIPNRLGTTIGSMGMSNHLSLQPAAMHSQTAFVDSTGNPYSWKYHSEYNCGTAGEPATCYYGTFRDDGAPWGQPGVISLFESSPAGGIVDLGIATVTGSSRLTQIDSSTGIHTVEHSILMEFEEPALNSTVASGASGVDFGTFFQAGVEFGATLTAASDVSVLVDNISVPGVSAVFSFEETPGWVNVHWTLPSNELAGAHSVQATFSVDADFYPGLLPRFTVGDPNAVVTAADIDDAFSSRGTSDAQFDLTGDGVIDDLDVAVLVTGVANTQFGDVNLDGKVNLQDFLVVARGDGSSWAAGDMNGDGMATAADVAMFIQGFGFGSTQETSFAAVPEPPSISLLVLAAASLLTCRARCR